MNILAAQSGGPTAAINATLAGVLKGAFEDLHADKVFGALNGIEGVLSENFRDMSHFKNEDNLNLLRQTPSSYLGSCRKKLPDLSENESIYIKIFDVLKKHGIKYFFYIGGNDSMDTAAKLGEYAKAKNIDIFIIGVPKTIDNDLRLTDHTPGYGSAAKFVANSIKQLALDTGVYQMKSAVILEVMGRNAGWLTAAAALANNRKNKYADIIAIPEVPFDADKFLAKIEKTANEKGTVMIALSEGIKDKNGAYVGEALSKRNAADDKFSHAVLGGVGRITENLVAKELGIKTRTVELSTLQRCFSALSSKCDIEESVSCGYEAYKMAQKGLNGIMAGFERISDLPYKSRVVPFDAKEAANFEKKIPSEMISEDGFSVTESFIRYAKPLIEGENPIIYENGVIKFTE